MTTMIHATKRIGLACAVLGLMVWASARSHAGIIYNNLPLDTYSPSGGEVVAGSNAQNGAHSVTEVFVATSSGTEADIKLAMVFFPGGTNTADFTLTLKDSSSNVLDVLHGIAPNGIGPTLSVVEVFSTLHPFLTAGQTYTLTASPGSATTNDGWDFGDSNQPGVTHGFRVETAASAVPEPSSLAMCGIAGAVGLIVARRRKRAA
jgi:hypothetical protein